MNLNFFTLRRHNHTATAAAESDDGASNDVRTSEAEDTETGGR
jgi:hypothetical protein